MKQIPLLIVIASIVVPMYLSGRSRPKQAVRTLWITMALLAFLWTLLCLKVYPVYVVPH